MGDNLWIEALELVVELKYRLNLDQVTEEYRKKYERKADKVIKLICEQFLN